MQLAEWQCDGYCWRALCVQSLADLMRVAAAAAVGRHDAVLTEWQLRLTTTHAAAAQQQQQQQQHFALDS
jgi:hypothetical protein